MQKGGQMNKNIELIKEKPPRSDIKIDELISGLTALGFEVRQGKGSHLIIRHSTRHDLFTVVPKPHGGSNCVKQNYIKKIQSLIEQVDD